MSRFQSEDIVGIFIGLDSSAYEYLASIIAPYQPEYSPLIGGFILIDNLNEYIVARIMDYVPQGEMVSYMGKKWLSEVALTPELIGQEIKVRKVSYQVKIKLLGVLKKNTNEFIPGIKRIPHITSKVIHPSFEMVETICNQALSDMASGIVIGNYWLNNNIQIHFDIEQLIGKRTFIFARAGYGKSNLMKIIASNWKKEFGSLIIFDPEGEYSVTDKKGRPGIMDKVPAILITNRRKIKEEIDVNIYDKLKFDLREFHPSFIIPILVNESKHEFIFFQKLMGLEVNQWRDLVDYLHENRWRADHYEIAEIMGMNDIESVMPIMNNLIHPIQKLHDSNSKLLNILETAVKAGHIIIIDISLLDSHNALKLTSIIISHFFNKNQRRFVGGDEDLFKITFTIEEAQSVIGNKSSISKFVELAKEGRKYQLGCIFITQQPGSISKEILSQGDNFFIFHLLTKTDLYSLKDCNAHFSNDILTQILNEPIKGKAYMWTSNQPFVLPVKILNFEEIAKPNEAKNIQVNNNILTKILKEVTTLDDFETNIFLKFKNLLNELKIDINDRKTIFSDEWKSTITKKLYKMLSEPEKAYLYDNEGIAVYDGKPFAVAYKYFENFYEKSKLYFQDYID